VVAEVPVGCPVGAVGWQAISGPQTATMQATRPQR
jgi:hypothetical protein